MSKWQSGCLVILWFWEMVLEEDQCSNFVSLWKTDVETWIAKDYAHRKIWRAAGRKEEWRLHERAENSCGKIKRLLKAVKIRKLCLGCYGKKTIPRNFLREDSEWSAAIQNTTELNEMDPGSISLFQRTEWAGG